MSEVLKEPEFGAMMFVLIALIETHPDKKAFAAKLREVAATVQAGLAASGTPIKGHEFRAALDRYLSVAD